MATAKELPPKPALPEIQLTLSGEEALALRAICGMVSGNPNEGPRRHTSAVYYALVNAGVPSQPNGREFFEITVGTIRSITEA